MTTQTPAGWYPDPYGSPQLRWWDGDQWTDATHAQDPGSTRVLPQQDLPSGPQTAHDWSATPANPTLRFGQPIPGQSAYGQDDPGTEQPWQAPYEQPPGGQAPQEQAPYEQGRPSSEQQGFAAPGSGPQSLPQPGSGPQEFTPPGSGPQGAGQQGPGPQDFGQQDFGQQGVGQPGPGQPGFGQPPYGQPPHGQSGAQPAYGQPPYGQSGAQPAYGQPPYGQSGAQPAYGQPPYGQSGAQPAYGPPGQPGQWGGAQLPGPGFGPPPKQSNPLPWVFGGVAALVVIGLIVAAGIFLVNRDGPTTASPPTSAPTQELPDPGQSSEPPTSQPSPTSGELPQPQDGRITDPQAGVSYTPPNGWSVPDAASVNGTEPAQQRWTSGVMATSHEKYDGTSDWSGNVYTGVLNELYPYAGPQGMQTTAKTVFVDFARYYPIAHETKIVKDEAIKVGDRDAWLLQFQFDFSKESEEKDYKWKKENGAVVVIDRGAGERPALVFVSVPDNLGTDVVDQVLSSLKPA